MVKVKQILTTDRVIREGREADYRRPPNFTKEQVQLNWQSLLKRSVRYAVILPKNPENFIKLRDAQVFYFGLSSGRAYKPTDRKHFIH